MKFFKKILFAAIITSFISSSAFSVEDVWQNDLRTKFLNNETVIMEINILLIQKIIMGTDLFRRNWGKNAEPLLMQLQGLMS